MDIAKFRIDPAAEDEGVWTALGGDAEVRLARIGNRRYREALAARLKPYRRAIRAGSMPEEAIEKLVTEAVCETVLLDWRNLELDGEPVPYSPARALELLSDPAMRDLRDLVVELAGDMELYRARELEEAEKNSPRPSRGRSSGAKGSAS